MNDPHLRPIPNAHLKSSATSLAGELVNQRKASPRAEKMAYPPDEEPLLDLAGRPIDQCAGAAGPAGGNPLHANKRDPDALSQANENLRDTNLAAARLLLKLERLRVNLSAELCGKAMGEAGGSAGGPPHADNNLHGNIRTNAQLIAGMDQVVAEIEEMI